MPPLSRCYRDSAINLNAFQAESVLPLDGGQPCMKYVLPIMYCWCMCVCVYSCTKKCSFFSWPNTTDALEKKVKKSRGAVACHHRALYRKIQDLNILTFMRLCVYMCVFFPFKIKTHKFLLISACIRNYISVTHSLKSCHLRAPTINTFVLTLCAAAADNKASAGNMKGQGEG